VAFRLGRVDFKLGRYDEAMAELDAALAEGEYSQARLYRGLVLEAVGRAAEARGEFEKAASLDSTDPEILRALARAKAPRERAPSGAPKPK
jgi:tetratricopeptide (TPR) repeat protein